MTMGSETCVIQVTNIAPSVTLEQMTTLFGYIGQIKEVQVYPKNDLSSNQGSKVCYIKYCEPWCTGVAQHLTNTVFIDRALIVLPVTDNKIPDETTALSLTSNAGLGGSNSGIVSQVVLGVKGEQIITTIDPRLTALGLPQYPPLPANMDPSKIEEIRRTVYVGNLDSSITAEQLLTFFNRLGEVKYVRMAGDEAQPTRFAFVEFTEQSSVANALQYNGVILGGRALKINHSNNAIVKPQAKSNEAAQKEIEEAMKRVREAQSLISAAIEPTYNVKLDKMEVDEKKPETKEKSRSRSRSKSKTRDRSSSRSRARRSRSRTRRSRSRERSRRSWRSRSREKKRSRSRERRRSRSRDRRSRSRDRRHRRRGVDRSERSRRKSRERDAFYPRDRDRDRDRDRERDRERDRDKERKRSSGDRDRSEKTKDKDRDRNGDRERDRERDKDRDRDRDRDRDKDKDREKDKEKSRKRSRSRSRSKSKKVITVDGLDKEKRKERLLKEENPITPIKVAPPVKERHSPPENDHSENSRNSYDKEECPSQGDSESSCKNCESSASEEQPMEGPALPPEYTGVQW